MPEDTSTAPWTAEDFNPERAWQLVTNLRSEVDSLKAQRATLTSERDAFKAQAASAETAKKDAEAALSRAKHEAALDGVKREFGISDEDADEFLSGDLSEDELRRKAERLAARMSPKADEDEEDDDAEDGDGSDDSEDAEGAEGGIPAKPRPKLTPGQGGSREPVDTDKIAEGILARRRGPVG